MAQAKQEQLPQSQPTFDQVFFDRAEGFIREQLMLIPELDSAMIIPVWAIKQEHVPFGLVKGRNGPPLGIAEQHRLMQQLQSAYEYQAMQLRNHLAKYEEYAGQLATRIRAAEAQLNIDGPDATPPT
jgi:hypothetical protein